MHWYELEHKHAGIRYVSLLQRHTGEERAILAVRHAPYIKAQQHNPTRWACHTCDGSPIGTGTHKPAPDTGIAQHAGWLHGQPLAASVWRQLALT